MTANEIGVFGQAFTTGSRSSARATRVQELRQFQRHFASISRSWVSSTPGACRLLAFPTGCSISARFPSSSRSMAHLYPNARYQIRLQVKSGWAHPKRWRRAHPYQLRCCLRRSGWVRLPASIAAGICAARVRVIAARGVSQLSEPITVDVASNRATAPDATVSSANMVISGRCHSSLEQAFRRSVFGVVF